MAAKTLTTEQLPYTGPYGLAASGLKSKGPTAEALKRFCGRMGFLEWTGDFDQHYNQRLEQALDKFDPGGQNGYGPKRYDKIRAARIPKGMQHAGELGLDDYAIKLIQDEAGSTGTTDEAKVQHFITEWWQIAIAHRTIWHYNNTHRPGDLTLDPDEGGESDCSLMCIQAVAYAGRQSRIPVIDPARQKFSGYGNTDLFEADWPKVGAPFRIGDLAHFHSERHVMQCIKPGDVQTAVWGSNGTEAAPESTTLAGYGRFPNEFLYVVRPELLA